MEGFFITVDLTFAQKRYLSREYTIKMFIVQALHSTAYEKPASINGVPNGSLRPEETLLWGSVWN